MSPNNGHRRATRHAFIGAILFALTSPAQVSEKHPAFEVVSIRPHNADSGPIQAGPTPDGFRYIGLPLFGLFQWAYPHPNERGLLRADRITGAPDWMRDSNERYDLIANVGKADLPGWQNAASGQAMLRAMLQSMLAERCKVVAHYENREVPVYDLVIGKGGPKFGPAETVDAEELRQKPGGGGMMLGTNVRALPGPAGIRYYGISMAILTQTLLPNMAGRPVVDKTGLTGYYDLTLPDIQRPSNDPAAPPEAGESIFTVLPDALGLRLQSSKGLVEMLVIDRVERPSVN